MAPLRLSCIPILLTMAGSGETSIHKVLGDPIPACSVGQLVTGSPFAAILQLRALLPFRNFQILSALSLSNPPPCRKFPALLSLMPTHGPFSNISAGQSPRATGKGHCHSLTT